MMKAKYDSRCHLCEEQIDAGGMITMDEGRAVHVYCSPSATASDVSYASVQQEGVTWRQSGKRTPTLCNECFLTHSGD